MANSKQAKKRVRQQATARLHNTSYRAMVRTAFKKVHKMVDDGVKDGLSDAFRLASKRLDLSVGKGHVHKNKAARLKSRLSTRVRDLLLAK